MTRNASTNHRLHRATRQRARIREHLAAAKADHRFVEYQTGAHAAGESEIMLASTAELFGHRPERNTNAVNRDAALMLRRTMESEMMAAPYWFELEQRNPWLRCRLDPASFVRGKNSNFFGVTWDRGDD